MSKDGKVKIISISTSFLSYQGKASFKVSNVFSAEEIDVTPMFYEFRIFLESIQFLRVRIFSLAPSLLHRFLSLSLCAGAIFEGESCLDWHVHCFKTHSAFFKTQNIRYNNPNPTRLQDLLPAAAGELRGWWQDGSCYRTTAAGGSKLRLHSRPHPAAAATTTTHLIQRWQAKRGCATATKAAAIPSDVAGCDTGLAAAVARRVAVGGLAARRCRAGVWRGADDGARWGRSAAEVPGTRLL